MNMNTENYLKVITVSQVLTFLVTVLCFAQLESIRMSHINADKVLDTDEEPVIVEVNPEVFEEESVEINPEMLEEEPVEPEEPTSYYPLTDYEKSIVEQVVMAEAGAESYEGQMAVAQCILNASVLEGDRPDVIVKAYGYTHIRKEPSESVIRAVEAVFDKGETALDGFPLFFYAPKWCNSEWHESQKYLDTIGGHKFFTLWEVKFNGVY